jgi:hypothetical protein
MLNADSQVDRQTDMTKLVVAFRKFANAPENHLAFPTEFSVVQTIEQSVGLYWLCFLCLIYS